uniref:Uncharacterized protein n=1 Tax=Oryza sativa subsp. japonica TaxID=39947 RepID=Q6Z641_ORYSJ|nr:hypothetical protein [Oryza sativa Japonica Group]
MNNFLKGKGDYCVSGSGSRWTGCTAAVYGNERPGSTLSKTDGRDLIGLPRLTGNDDDDVGDDVTTGGGSGAHARRRTTARWRKRRASMRSGRCSDPYRGTNGGGRRRGRSGGDGRLDDDGGLPAILGDDGGVDEDGDGLVNPALSFPSDDDDRSDGVARLDLRQRQRCKSSRC